MTKNAEMIEQRSDRAEDISKKDSNQSLSSSALNVEIVPDLYNDKKLIVNPEITQLTCDIYDELQRARNKYMAKKQELNNRETMMTERDNAKLERLEDRMLEWQDLLNDALKPESH